MNLSLNNDEKQIIANKIKCISETDMKNLIKNFVLMSIDDGL